MVPLSMYVLICSLAAEYTQRRMVNPEFDAKNAGSSWGTFIMKTPELSMCATQLG